MRSKLKEISGKRETFIGKFKRYGSKNRYGNQFGNQDTILLSEIYLSKNMQIISNHVWINIKHNKTLNELDLKDGDYITFNANVKPYLKGYKGKRIDLRIHNPRRLDYELSNICQISKYNENLLV